MIMIFLIILNLYIYIYIYILTTFKKIIPNFLKSIWKKKHHYGIGETTDIDVSVSFEDAYIGDVKKITVEIYDEDDVPNNTEVSILPCEGTYTFKKNKKSGVDVKS